MADRQFFTMKFKSSRLKEFGYNVEISFDEAKELGEVIALSENQFLRSIRDIKGKNVDYDYLESLYSERDKLKKMPNSDENRVKIKKVQNQINDILFIPEYKTIVMEHNSHYKNLFKHGLKLNGKKYVRLSCSAGQARVSTVVFCEEEIANILKVKLDNGRNLNKKLTPSKFNAYLGVSGSATKVVSSPRVCVVPDYKSKTKVRVNYVTETEWDKDDIIEERDLEMDFNRFDGQGLVSYEMASKWAEELGLDYVPAQWCIRQNYVKGMLCTFPIHEFCEEKNKKNYFVKTSYKDSDGNHKYVDLRNIDVILSESQFKLWDSFDSIEVYQENCKKNNLSWGVSIYTPKQDKDILKMNYQFIQTLDLNKKDIEKLCKKFVDWISGVSSSNIYYTLLFLLGKNITEEKILEYLHSNKNYWVKSLIANHDLLKDNYIRNKIYGLIRKRIKKGCLGQIIVDGNFQTIVSDPYAMMQHVCEQEVTGLLKGKEYYSSYWNNKRIKQVDSMRAPLTYRSEHLKLNLVENKELNYWYRYCYTGIIVNVFGSETLNWAGSDFDFDILATTSDPNILKGVYEDELPVVYDPPKPVPKHITDEDLFNADLFAFGSAIGSITNKSTTGYALLPTLDKDSLEYKTIMNRLRMCTKLQSAQIDKAKIGREVKGIPNNWVFRKKISDTDSDEIKKDKEFHNITLLDKYPYFFTYLYKDTKSKYYKHYNGYDLSCKQKFGIPLKELLAKKRKTEKERNFLSDYYEFMPVIDSDCVMNNLCKYIESIDFSVRQKIHEKPDKEIYLYYLSGQSVFCESTYAAIKQAVNEYNKRIQEIGQIGLHSSEEDSNDKGEIGVTIDGNYSVFKNKLNDLCSNSAELVDYLITLFYVDSPSLNKDILWNTYGQQIFENIKQKNSIEKILFPLPCPNGEIEYLNQRYTLKEVSI